MAEPVIVGHPIGMVCVGCQVAWRGLRGSRCWVCDREGVSGTTSQPGSNASGVYPT